MVSTPMATPNALLGTPSPPALHPIQLLKAAQAKEIDSNAPPNTLKAYQPKQAEWKAFCDYQYASLPESYYRYAVEPEKFHRFMYYQVHREQKKRGRSGDGGFDRADYYRVMERSVSMVHGLLPFV